MSRPDQSTGNYGVAVVGPYLDGGQYLQGVDLHNHFIIPAIPEGFLVSNAIGLVLGVKWLNGIAQRAWRDGCSPVGIELVNRDTKRLRAG